MFKFVSASLIVEVASSCECDAQLSWPATNCYTLSKTYDCSGCSICVFGYDSSSYQVTAWTESVNQIRTLFQVPPLTWSQEIASDVYKYIKQNGFQHSCSPDDPDSPTCSYNVQPPLGPAGENLFSSDPGCSYVPDIAMDWAKESLHCNEVDCSDQAASQKGHFTAMTWMGAKTFGCGSTADGVTMCRFKGDDTKDCTTPNMGGCAAKNVNDWHWFPFDNACGQPSLQYNSSLSV